MTLWQMLERWFLAMGPNNWLDSLLAINAAYNIHEHGTIGKPPARVTQRDIAAIRFNHRAWAMHMAARVDQKALEPGTPCDTSPTM